MVDNKLISVWQSIQDQVRLLMPCKESFCHLPLRNSVLLIIAMNLLSARPIVLPCATPRKANAAS